MTDFEITGTVAMSKEISDKKAAKIARVYKRSRIPKGILVDKKGKPVRPGKENKKK